MAMPRFLERYDDQYVMVDGLKIRYWDVGSGSPVLLLHGLGASAEVWSFNIEALASQCRVLVPDLPGSGRSVKEGFEYSLNYAAKFLASFLSKVGAATVSAVGNSMGGIIALQFTLDYPQLVDRLVLIDSAGLGREASFSLRFNALPLRDRLVYSRARIEVTVKQTLRSILSNADSLPPELVDCWVELSCLPGAVSAMHRAARVGLTFWGQKRSIILRDRLSEIKIPTMVVWGSADPLFPVKHAHTAHRLLPGSQLHILNGCRHCPQLERPAEFNDLMLKFLHS